MTRINEALIAETARMRTDRTTARAKKLQHKARIRELKMKAHEDFKKRNIGWFKLFDTIGIIMIAINFMAVFLTDALVVKADPTMTLVEANPTQCQWNGYACHSMQFKDVIIPFLIQGALWAGIILVYLYERKQVRDYPRMWILVAILVFYCIVIGWDGIHDLGLYAGKILYG